MLYAFSTKKDFYQKLVTLEQIMNMVLPLP
ncbi:hypothetical protein KSF78_0006429 [Schistosoma japonicum]|nr:hypothetical protein KSF78_0006429 [Schistosoma japonicum]